MKQPWAGAAGVQGTCTLGLWEAGQEAGRRGGKAATLGGQVCGAPRGAEGQCSKQARLPAAYSMALQQPWRILQEGRCVPANAAPVGNTAFPYLPRGMGWFVQKVLVSQSAPSPELHDEINSPKFTLPKFAVIAEQLKLSPKIPQSLGFW